MTDKTSRTAKDEALAELDRATTRYYRAERTFHDAREHLHAVIVRHLTEDTARPGEVAEHSPYDRNHVGRIARAAGVPPRRQRTVRSIRDDDSDSPGIDN